MKFSQIAIITFGIALAITGSFIFRLKYMKEDEPTDDDFIE